MRRAGGGRVRCDDDVHFEIYQLGCKTWKALVVPFGRAPFDDQVFALDLAELAHAQSERAVIMVGFEKIHVTQ